MDGILADSKVPGLFSTQFRYWVLILFHGYDRSGDKPGLSPVKCEHYLTKASASLGTSSGLLALASLPSF